MARKHFVDGVLEDMPAEMEAQLDADAAEWAANKKTRGFEHLRTERNARLSETDWAALSDVTLSDDMKNYRQALRDLPANTSDPSNITWPTKPS